MRLNPSELTDAERTALEPLLSGPAKFGRTPRYRKLAVLNAIFYAVCLGCS
ncbi:MAG: transposase [Rhodospirillales bacterium]|nr:transposase [Acetobacter sp.]